MLSVKIYPVGVGVEILIYEKCIVWTEKDKYMK
jgi:hypothetical protein